MRDEFAALTCICQERDAIGCRLDLRPLLCTGLSTSVSASQMVMQYATIVYVPSMVSASGRVL